MDLRNKIFWGVFYTLVFGYLMYGLIWQNESPIDSLKNFPLQIREKSQIEAAKKLLEASKPL